MNETTAPRPRPSGVVLVAPLEATWPEQASALLTERGYGVARLHALSLVGFLLPSTGVAGALVDAAMIGPEAAAAGLRALRRLHPQLSIVVVGALSEHEMHRVGEAQLTAVLGLAVPSERICGLFPDLRAHQGSER